ncbi:MAG: alpha-1,4-glucan--maltose-1-phosphate maltosyltransferase, partial [Acidimicrobiaceae bacterium]|nr:alpha-1,4-glucan--maltose-1-phosphate maltosyltransferase [Acidimicrobiaceae bacterium]
PLITKLNGIRRRHRALKTMRSLVLHPTDNPALIAYSKRSDDRSDVVLTVVNLDPLRAQDGWVTLRHDALGVDAVRRFQVFDELSGSTWSWQGDRGYVRLDPADAPAHIFVVRQP